jgi:2-epi-5-epi-valiolone 7-kinase
MFPMENIKMVGISMGAALNAHTKLILDSAPLWGDNSSPVDLLSMLRERNNDLTWTIINDVTAALLRYIVEFENSDILKTCLITISTGIACRTYDAKSNKIPVDRQHGIQGEIGHLPINFKYENRSVDLRCDCGVLNHLSAFCSGRGILKILRLLAKRYQQKFRSSILGNLTDGNVQQLTFEHFATAINGHDLFAMSILDSVTQPIAKKLIDLWTFDPEVERVILTGGVIYTLDNYYLESLIKNLQAIGLYQVSKCDDSFFRQRILIGMHDDESGLIGAAFSVNLQLAYSQLYPKA